MLTGLSEPLLAESATSLDDTGGLLVREFLSCSPDLDCVLSRSSSTRV
jgi:hypothetical protein